MKSPKLFKTLATSLVLISFGLASISIQAATMEEFNVAWEKADQLRQKAASVGFEWRDTGKMLASAKAAAEEGDLDKAMKLTAVAHEQGDDAYAQYQREQKNWMARVPN